MGSLSHSRLLHTLTLWKRVVADINSISYCIHVLQEFSMEVHVYTYMASIYPEATMYYSNHVQHCEEHKGVTGTVVLNKIQTCIHVTIHTGWMRAPIDII